MALKMSIREFLSRNRRSCLWCCVSWHT